MSSGQCVFEATPNGQIRCIFCSLVTTLYEVRSWPTNFLFTCGAKTSWLPSIKQPCIPIADPQGGSSECLLCNHKYTQNNPLPIECPGFKTPVVVAPTLSPAASARLQQLQQQLASYSWDFLPDASPSPEPVAKLKCHDCKRELSEYLDAYYGRDLYLKEICSKCRLNHKEFEFGEGV